MKRRRFLRVIGAGAGMAGLSAGGLPSALALPKQPAQFHQWTGVALGADANIQIHHRDPEFSELVLKACMAEIELCENMFSLHNNASVLSRLNKSGKIEQAPNAFIELLETSKEFFTGTAGHFDPSVQPLWHAYKDCVGSGAVNVGLLHERVSEARCLIGYERVRLGEGSVALQPGMALTLNGIAQGFLADRVTKVLRRHGIKSALVETGETYGLGVYPSDREWQLGIPSPVSPVLSYTVSLNNRALATSSPAGTIFDPEGRYHHLFNPHDGMCADGFASISVSAPSAAMADALSTAFASMPLRLIRGTVRRMPDVGVYLLDPQGGAKRLGRV